MSPTPAVIYVPPTGCAQLLPDVIHIEPTGRDQVTRPRRIRNIRNAALLAAGQVGPFLALLVFAAAMPWLP